MKGQELAAAQSEMQPSSLPTAHVSQSSNDLVQPAHVYRPAPQMSSLNQNQIHKSQFASAVHAGDPLHQQMHQNGLYPTQNQEALHSSAMGPHGLAMLHQSQAGLGQPLGASASAFDQHTYMQLLQRQSAHAQSSYRSSGTHSRQRSTGRVGSTDMYQTSSRGTPQLAQQPQEPPQMLLSPHGPANLGYNTARPSMQMYPPASASFQQNPHEQMQLLAGLLPSRTPASSQPPSGAVTPQAQPHLLNQSMAGPQLEQLAHQQSLYRSQPQQPASMDQFQLLAQLLQSPHQQQQQQQHSQYGFMGGPPQTQPDLNSTQGNILQQLLFHASQQQHQQQQQQQQQHAGTGYPARSAMSPPPMSQQLPMFQHAPQMQQTNPQLQQITQNVNAYRKLIEDYKNSNVAMASAPSSLPPQPSTVSLSNQKHVQPAEQTSSISGGATSATAHGFAEVDLRQVQQQVNDVTASDDAAPSFKSATPQYLAEDLAKEVGGHAGNSQRRSNSGVAEGEQHLGEGLIAWPSMRPPTAQRTPVEHTRQSPPTQPVEASTKLVAPANAAGSNRSMHHFACEAEESSVIADNNAILGALEPKKQMSPIQDKHELERPAQQEQSSSFLKDEALFCQNQAEARKQNDSQQEDGILWVSQAPQRATPMKEREAGQSPPDKDDREPKDERPSADAPSQWGPTNSVDAQVIKKQEKTFEELLESQLKNDQAPSKAPVEPTAPKVEVKSKPEAATAAPEAPEEHVTPMKTPTSATKKAFLRRGSSAKYDPKEARKKSQGSTKKFKYYADNFRKKPLRTAEPSNEASRAGSPPPALLSGKQGTSKPPAEESKPVSSPKKQSSASNRRIAAKKSPDREDHSKTSIDHMSSKEGSSRLKASQTAGGSRLKFNHPSGSQSGKTTANSRRSIGSDHAPSKAASKKQEGKATSQPHGRSQATRASNAKQLFRKQASKQESSKDSFMRSEKTSEGQEGRGEQPNAEKACSMGPHLVLESSINEDIQDSFIEKNSIAEFEMLEKECFKSEAAPSRKAAGPSKAVGAVQVVDESPARESARALISDLKAASPFAGSAQREDKLDELEQQLMGLISEQEQEVARLRDENSHVLTLQQECQKQLERLNREAADQDKAKKSAEVKKLKGSLKQKEDEIFRLQESLLAQQEQNSKLQVVTQALQTKLALLAPKTNVQAKEVQTEPPKTRSVLMNTCALSTEDVAVQVDSGELQGGVLQTADQSTPRQDEESRLGMEESKSVAVSMSISPKDHLDDSVKSSPHDLQLSAKQVTFAKESSQESKQAAAEATQKATKNVTFKLEGEAEEVPKEQPSQAELDRPEEELPAGAESDFGDDEFDLVFPEEYHSEQAYSSLVLANEAVSSEGKRQKFYSCGKKEIIFPNGVRREVWPDGYQVVFFQNADIKQTFKGGKIVYFFAEAKTTQTTFPDGLQVFKFQNNQIEKHFPDGTKEISFPDGTVKCLFADGEEESIFPDGTIQKIEKSGLRIIEYPHGQRDFMYPDGTKVREYASGAIKRYNPDGTVEELNVDDEAPDSDPDAAQAAEGVSPGAPRQFAD